MTEINEVVYPQQFDTVQNFPSVTEISESSGEDINRNRDAILVLERTLGRNPQIGRYTVDPNTATVSQRIDILENGIAEGRFAYRNLDVYGVLKVTTDAAGLAQVDIGGTGLPGGRIAPVFIRGPLSIKDSGMANKEIRIEVPFISSARKNVIQAASIEGEPLLRITDTNANPMFPGRLALQIDGNVSITNGRLYADFAIEHSQLLGIDTTPRIGVNAIHVSRGDYHSHVRRQDPSTGALLNEVDPNPPVDNKGLVDHIDLLNIYTKNGQTGFVPVDGVAYHITDGDGHDHTGGRGAQVNHSTLLNIDPALSTHVTKGDKHTHSGFLGDGGALIDHNSMINIGFLSHADIDRTLNVEFRNHLELIDPTNASDVDPAKQGLGFHVPQGHVSDPSAHHTRYTDQEAVSAQVLITPVTDVYQEGRNGSVSSHIQAIGNGTVATSNPHGTSAGDIGALEGFDSQGNVPDFTKQFLEQVVASILTDPAFNVLRGNIDETITGYWTFSNTTLLINEASTSVTRDVIELINSGSGSSIDITQAGSASAIKIAQGGAGSALEITKQNAGAGDVIDIINNGIGAAVDITQVGAGIGLIVNNSGTGVGVSISQNGGANRALEIYQNAASHGIYVTKTNTGVGTCIAVENSGTGAAIDITQVGAGIGIKIAQAGNENAVAITKTSTDASSAVIVGVSSGSGVGLLVSNSGTGAGVNITQNGANRALDIYQNAAGHGIQVTKTNVGAGTCLAIENAGTDAGINIHQIGAAVALGITREAGGVGTEHCIQITNNGIGQDIVGNASNWMVSRDGVATLSGAVITNGLSMTPKNRAIASGVITIDNTFGTIYLNPETAAADDLDSIHGSFIDGQIIILVNVSAYTINCRDGVGGNLSLAGTPKTLSARNDRLQLQWDNTLTLWCQISFSDNA